MPLFPKRVKICKRFMIHVNSYYETKRQPWYLFFSLVLVTACTRTCCSLNICSVLCVLAVVFILQLGAGDSLYQDMLESKHF